MRIFFSVGEPSGDLHAANLIKRLKQLEPHLEAMGFGGPRMQDQGCRLMFDLTQLAIMFVTSALRNFTTFHRLLREAEQCFASQTIDAVVLIDYPGFNWWIARKAQKHHIPVFYYGVPQVWAWAPWRIRKIKRLVDVVICKLPFEQAWFRTRGCHAHYVGHPYFDALSTHVLDESFITKIRLVDKRRVLLLPGSRDGELRNNLSLLLLVAQRLRQQRSDLHCVMGCLHRRHRDEVREKCEQAGIDVFFGKTQELMTLADVCVACSGSVSLELLYHRLPTVIVYQLSFSKMVLQALLLRCKFITLPNLMQTTDIRKRTWGPFDPDAQDAEPAIMPEYLAWRDVSEKVTRRLLNWLDSRVQWERKKNELDALAIRYAEPGATARAAELIVTQLRAKTRCPQTSAA